MSAAVAWTPGTLRSQQGYHFGQAALPLQAPPVETWHPAALSQPRNARVAEPVPQARPQFGTVVSDSAALSQPASGQLELQGSRALAWWAIEVAASPPARAQSPQRAPPGKNAAEGQARLRIRPVAWPPVAVSSPGGKLAAEVQPRLRIRPAAWPPVAVSSPGGKLATEVRRRLRIRSVAWPPVAVSSPGGKLVEV
jgi:hypothetical protein